MTARCNRRIFLRGVGGAAVAAPFLSSVWDRKAKGAGRAPKPRQLIVMFTHYGCITTKFFPVKSHGPLAAGDLANTLAPLAPYVGKLLIPRGIRAMNEWSQYNTGPGHGLGQGNDPHLNGPRRSSRCSRSRPTPTTRSVSTRTTSSTPCRSARSLDHIMAQQLSPKGTPLSCGLATGTIRAQSAISS